MFSNSRKQPTNIWRNTAYSTNPGVRSPREERISLLTPVLCEIGKKYGKSAAQVALRFLLQSDVVVIPKSTHKERMAENINVFDFALDENDMNAIRALDEEESLFFSHYDSAVVEMLTKLH